MHTLHEVRTHASLQEVEMGLFSEKSIYPPTEKNWKSKIAPEIKIFCHVEYITSSKMHLWAQINLFSLNPFFDDFLPLFSLSSAFTVETSKAFFFCFVKIKSQRIPSSSDLMHTESQSSIFSMGRPIPGRKSGAKTINRGSISGCIRKTKESKRL